ncbi:MAG TPA: thioesterase family protein [Burkholderiales bacterium]|jgi:acyl-CoA thioester hydrolase|nr:thioesterase family protein [Burkholderiales bacterium]
METASRNLVWSQRLAIRWSDMDANGHVNNAAFFTYFEQTRIEWLQSIAAQTTADGHGPVVKKASCTYFLPVSHPAMLELKLFVGKPGRTSFPTYSEIWTTGTPQQKVAEGETLMVWVHRKTGAPHPVPEFLRRLMPVQNEG